MRILSLLILTGLLMVISQAFNKTSQPTKPTKHVSDIHQPIKPIAKVNNNSKSTKPNFRSELEQHLNLTGSNKTNNDVIRNVILAANSPMARTFPVDESQYEQQPIEPEQPLVAIDEQAMTQQMQLSGLNPEQTQVILEAITEANTEDSRLLEN